MKNLKYLILLVFLSSCASTPKTIIHSRVFKYHCLASSSYGLSMDLDDTMAYDASFEDGLEEGLKQATEDAQDEYLRNLSGIISEDQLRTLHLRCEVVEFVR